MIRALVAKLAVFASQHSGSIVLAVVCLIVGIGLATVVARSCSSGPDPAMQILVDQERQRVDAQLADAERRNAEIDRKLGVLSAELDDVHARMACLEQERKEAHDAVERADSIERIDAVLRVPGRGGTR